MSPSHARRVLTLTVAGVLSVGASLTPGADWPQYRGANHDGISTEPLSSIEKPKELWKVPTPDGFSSFAIANGMACTIIQRNGEEHCLALNADTGKELWATPFDSAKYEPGGDSGEKDNRGGDGPRSTPTIDGDRVYVVGTYQMLTCLDAKTGKEVWKKDLFKECDAQKIQWANAASPLIEGDLLFFCTSAKEGSLMAFNKKDGSVAWKKETETATHATPIAATILGQRQVIFFVKSGLVSVVPETGAVLWRYPFPWKVSTAASPVVCGDIVYCSAGYGVGAGAAKITKEGNTYKATELWMLKGNAICNHWSTPVYKDGYLYGMFSFKQFGKGPIKCLEVATGKEMWSQPDFGAGGAILVGGNLLALSDRGKLTLIEASPKEYKELSSYQAVTGKCWNSPSFSNGRIYARSTKEGVCLEVK